MKQLRVFMIAAVAALLFAMVAPYARSQVSIGVQIGPPPVCPYGYFDYPPYDCAPFGYYGPEWFPDGYFLEAGPWFHGPEDFHGWVNRRYDPRYGYRGPFPHRGERPDWGRHRGWEHNFHGDYNRHEVGHDNGNRYSAERDRHDSGNHNSGYDNRGRGHDNGRGNVHDDSRACDNGHGNGHEDDGH